MKRTLLCLLVLLGAVAPASAAPEREPRLILASGCPRRCDNGHPDHDSEIVLMTMRGERLKFLTDNASFDSNGRWSPDESKIAFTCRGRKGNESPNEICLMNSDGSGRRRLTKNDVNDSGPAWSPDGRWIVFTRENYPNYDLYRMRADGSNVQQLTDLEGGEVDADWSPNDDHIIFTHWGSDLQLIPETTWIMESDGSNPKQLAEGDETQHDPVWSPDGRFIAVSQYYDTGDSSQGWQITLLRADGSHIRRLTTGAAGFNFLPAWSPSQSWIVFLRGRDSHIYRVRPDGTDLTVVYEDRRKYTASDWRSR